jgi:hypothetical protein
MHTQKNPQQQPEEKQQKQDQLNPKQTSPFSKITNDYFYQPTNTK